MRNAEDRTRGSVPWGARRWRRTSSEEKPEGPGAVGVGVEVGAGLEEVEGVGGSVWTSKMGRERRRSMWSGTSWAAVEPAGVPEWGRGFARLGVEAYGG